ncbi:MAG TPA: hypothetical protein VM936_03160 [Pyrinomonadaceae bacterium]|nr:hypothetical protein [Pyrinomonadaceae bacterium]
MLEERCARVVPGVACRVLKSLLLASALVFAVAPPRAGRAGSPSRPGVVVAATAQTSDDSGGAGVIAFEAGGEIYVTDASGGSPRRIVAAKSGVTHMEPALSPDGSRVAFSSNLEGTFHIYVVGVDGRGMRRVTSGSTQPESMQPESVPTDDSEPAWSPDGTRIAFARGFDATGNGVFVQSCAEWSDILVVDVDAAFPSPINLTNGERGTDPAWSPDGSRIAFASDRAGNFDIYTMSSEDGGGVEQLTDDQRAEADPVWSPDGSHIAYTAGLRQIVGGTQCGTMPISGLPTCNCGGPRLTGDGGPYIYLMDSAGGEKKSVTQEGGAAGPAWSPDGSRIAFVAGQTQESEDVQLYFVRAAAGGGKWTQLTSDASPKASPSWSRAVGR